MSVNLELDKSELIIVHEAVSLLMTVKSAQITNFENRKSKDEEENLERLFRKMDSYANTADVWVKILKTVGATQEEISEFLREKL